LEVRGDAPKELTKEESDQLKNRAVKLKQEGVKLKQEGRKLFEQGKLVEATKVEKQVLAIFERLYPKEKYRRGHPDLADSLNQLGILSDLQGQYAAAREYYQQALAMRQQLYRKDHPLLAASLHNLAYFLREQGEYTAARDYQQQAVAMLQRLYPKDKYPQGEWLLASSLHNLGYLLQKQGEYAAARDYFNQALAMMLRLYPKKQYPRGHPGLAIILDNMGNILRAQGEYAAARDYYQLALDMRRQLYPKAEFPRGHAELAQSLDNLGSLLMAQGEDAAAHDYFKRALAMFQQLYPKDKYPQGHPDLAICLDNLAWLLQRRGEYAPACQYLKQIVDMFEARYPKKQFPRGHPDLANSLSNLGQLLQDQGEYARARDYLKQALAMRERLYPKAQYPQGHPGLAVSLNNLGLLLKDQGDYAAARDYLKQAVDMWRKLYPKEKYPPGHPKLAIGLNNLGNLLRVQGDYAAARDYLKQGLAMRQKMNDHFVASVSEAEALSLLSNLPLTRDVFLSVTRHLSDPDAASYLWVWRTKAAILHALQSRHQTLSQAAQAPRGKPDPKQAKIRLLWQELRTKRAELSRLLLRPEKDAKAHRQRLQKISTSKEDLERQLAKLVPPFARAQALQRLDFNNLIKELPRQTVLIDYLRYVRFDQDRKVAGKKGERRSVRYVAFVLGANQAVKRVELGLAAPIDKAIAAWRLDIRDRRVGAAARDLRRLVWEPLAKYVPPDTRTVFLAPDAELTRLPWAALPGKKKGTVLLEDYALAIVPHGPFLLDRLTAEADKDQNNDSLLAVGGVRYDAKPETEDPSPRLAYGRSAVRGEGQLVWHSLPGTLAELKQVVARTGKRPVRQWSGAKASTARLLADLPEARWAHLATHGFFADKKLRSVLQIDEKLFDPRSSREGPPPGARNPLVLSGLVLAGANLPLPKDLKERTESDGGILTAEAIAGLPLPKLELAVLSACETGLGEVAGGEGVFGLQRAFHLAGARNVVASLWKVDDQATCALMALFYDKLWRQKKPAIQALREAQLTLYHHPERITTLAKERGPNFDKVVRLPVTPDKEMKPSPKGKAATKLWAGFVLSGLGR
jgi:CHAT domain-containing protein/Tfp pilus assembly protein PilF